MRRRSWSIRIAIAFGIKLNQGSYLRFPLAGMGSLEADFVPMRNTGTVWRLLGGLDDPRCGHATLHSFH